MKCAECGFAPVQHYCSSCQAPQPVNPKETYFEAFNLNPQFDFLTSELESKFIELSRLLHPDRFTKMPVSWQKTALEKMSFLNRAFSTLKSPEKRKDYLISLFINRDEKVLETELALKWAERWFILQDQYQTKDELTLFTQEIDQEIDKLSHLAHQDEVLFDQLKTVEQEERIKLAKSVKQKLNSIQTLESLKHDIHRVIIGE